jgi:hypothetical protein
VGFVYDYGKAVAWQGLDLFRDDGELLQGGDDDALVVLQRLFELPYKCVAP